MADGIDEQCLKCGARCCQYFCFEIDEPDSCEEFEDLRWYLCHEGVSIHIDDGSWFISIANRCKMLDAENRCRIYDERPLICRKYSPDDCDYTTGDYGYEEEFKTPEDIEAYARKTLGRKRFEQARANKRAKLVRKAAKAREKRRRKAKRRGGKKSPK